MHGTKHHLGTLKSFVDMSVNNYNFSVMKTEFNILIKQINELAQIAHCWMEQIVW